jgi:hypothetical protein
MTHATENQDSPALDSTGPVEQPDTDCAEELDTDDAENSDVDLAGDDVDQSSNRDLAKAIRLRQAAKQALRAAEATLADRDATIAALEAKLNTLRPAAEEIAARRLQAETKTFVQAPLVAEIVRRAAEAEGVDLVTCSDKELFVLTCNATKGLELEMNNQPKRMRPASAKLVDERRKLG